ncbi:MAG: tetratricopeptide repeat protein [Lachnospiraceae bacterium]|nr:tetratricopeptide repeat protein [Lachnospiraceae bacterium]
MMNFEQELSKFESGLDREEVKKVIMTEGGEASSLQQNKLDQIMKRYGLALNYCKTDSFDLAYIQIQKVARLLPGNLNVQLLSALICIHEGKEELALQALERAEALSADHPDVKRYKEELTVKEIPQEVQSVQPEEEVVEAEGTAKESGKKAPKKISSEKPKKEKPKKVVTNGSDFEEVTSNKKSFIYLGLGFLIGVIAMLVLVVPTARSAVKDQYATEAESYEDQLKAKETEIGTLKEDLKAAEDATKDAKEEVKSYKNGNKDLYQAADDYIAGKNVEAAEKLMDIDTKILTTKEAKTLYNTIKDKTYASAAQTFYQNGMSQYNARNYTEAEKYLKKAIKANDSNASYYYYLARSYEEDGKTAQAIKYYDKVIELGSYRPTESKTRRDQLKAKQSTEKKTESTTEK